MKRKRTIMLLLLTAVLLVSCTNEPPLESDTVVDTSIVGGVDTSVTDTSKGDTNIEDPSQQEYKAEYSRVENINDKTKAFKTELILVLGGDNCSPSEMPEEAYQDKGYLYIADGGVPTFIYKKDGEVGKVIPDTTLTDVVAIYDHKFYGMMGWPNVYLCLKANGEVGMIVSRILKIPEYATPQLDEIEEFISKQKEVVKICVSDRWYDFAFLYKNGKVALYPSDKKHQETQEKTDRVHAWTDIVDIEYDGYVVKGIKSDGTTVSEQLIRYLPDSDLAKI